MMSLFWPVWDHRDVARDAIRYSEASDKVCNCNCLPPKCHGRVVPRFRSTMLNGRLTIPKKTKHHVRKDIRNILNLQFCASRSFPAPYGHKSYHRQQLTISRRNAIKRWEYQAITISFELPHENQMKSWECRKIITKKYPHSNENSFLSGYRRQIHTKSTVRLW